MVNIKNLKAKGLNESFINLKQWQKDFIMYPYVANPQRDSDILDFVREKSSGLAAYKMDKRAQSVVNNTDPISEQYISDMRKRVWRKFKIDQEQNEKLEVFAKFCGHPSYMVELVLTEIEYAERRGELKAKDELILNKAKEMGIYELIK